MPMQAGALAQHGSSTSPHAPAAASRRASINDVPPVSVRLVASLGFVVVRSISVASTRVVRTSPMLSSTTAHRASNTQDAANNGRAARDRTTRAYPTLGQGTNGAQRCLSPSMRSLIFALTGSILSLTTVKAHAQCVFEGVATARIDGPPTAVATAITEAMRVTLSGARATIEGRAPLAFRTVVAASDVELFVADPGVRTTLVGAARGVRARVESVSRDVALVTLSAEDSLEVRGVRLPCAALTTERPTESLRAAAAPAYSANRRWRSSADAHREWRCTERRGARSCGEVTVPGRCRAIGDGSVCGYHPRRRTLRLFAAPSAASESVEVFATADVSFADDDGRPGWLRVISRVPSRGAVVVRGWARAADVRWTQEVPPYARSMGIGAVGVAGRVVARSTRLGFVTLERDAEVHDERSSPWARVAESWCTRGEQPQGSARVWVHLPGQRHATPGASVAAEHVRWVDACPAQSP
jgi:hypothetical protein